MSTPAPGVETEMACWPPVRRAVTSQGWWVGLSGGLTRRANSAVAVSDPVAGVAAAVDEVESLYAEAGLPPVMRVGRGALQDDVRAELERRAWAERSLASVLARDLADLPRAAATRGVSTRVVRDPDDAWLDLHLDVKARTALNGAATADTRRALARAILTGGEAWHLTACEGDQVVGIIRVARAGRWGALSSLAVRPGHRRRGIGRLLTLRGLEVAREHGASHAFLQVEAHNVGAAALYGDLGFERVDEYSYLERPAVGGAGEQAPGGC